MLETASTLGPATLSIFNTLFGPLGSPALSLGLIIDTHATENMYAICM